MVSCLWTRVERIIENSNSEMDIINGFTRSVSKSVLEITTKKVAFAVTTVALHLSKPRSPHMFKLILKKSALKQVLTPQKYSQLCVAFQKYG